MKPLNHLEITKQGQGLDNRVVAVHSEVHVCDRLSRDDRTSNHLVREKREQIDWSDNRCETAIKVEHAHLDHVLDTWCISHSCVKLCHNKLSIHIDLRRKESPPNVQCQ